MSVQVALGIAFSPDEAPGAWPNGSRVRKETWEPGDVLPRGALGTVLGSVGPFDPAPMGSPYGYFIEWDGFGRLLFFVRSAKVSLERPS